MKQHYTNRNYQEADRYENREWKLKRKEILLRDGFECRKCGNSKLNNKSIVGKIIQVNEHVSALGLLNKSDPVFYKEAYKIEYEDDRGKKYTQNILSHIKTNEYASFVGLRIYLCTVRDKGIEAFFKDSINMIVSDTIINCIENPNPINTKDEWFFVRNLHVHHLRYPDDDNIANVPNKDLITLCARCHQNEHPQRKLVGSCD